MHAHLRSALLAAALSSVALPALAQGVAHSFSELRLMVREGQTVTVVDTAGREVKGQITSLTPAQLVLGSGDRRAWHEADIATIRQRRPDSLGNGALIGLAVGVGVGIAGGIAGTRDNENEKGWVPFLAAVYGGIGAAIGVGIDALITREHDVFRRESSAPQVRLQPLLYPHGGGLRVAIVF